MTREQFTALVDLIEAIAMEYYAERSNTPPALMLDVRRLAIKCRQEAMDLLVEKQEQPACPNT